MPCEVSLADESPFTMVVVWCRGAGVVQWLEWWTRDQNVPGLSPSRSSWRIFLFRVSFLCWLLFWYPFHLCVTAVACKRSRSFCQKCMRQVTAKHACTLPLWLWMHWHCKLVHGWVVCTECAPRRQQFHVAPAMHRPNITVATPLQWMLFFKKNMQWKDAVTHSESRATRVQWVCLRAENSPLPKWWIIIMIIIIMSQEQGRG